jgi:hypothetical protein
MTVDARQDAESVEVVMARSSGVMAGGAWMVLAAMAACALMLGAFGCKRDDSSKPAPPAADRPGVGPTEAPTSPPTPAAPEKPAAPAAAIPGPPDKEGWRSVFDGKTLTGWKSTPFGSEGKVEIKDGQLILDRGVGDLTGVTWAGGAIPRMNYEISLEANRLDGSDFFCGLTFPVRNDCCSLIVGGWGGSLVGISCFDYMDAANNETTKMMEFENNRWYSIRVRVTETKIEAWIDDKQIVDAEPGTRKISVRFEVEPSQPFGIAAWRTKAALRNIRIRSL